MVRTFCFYEFHTQSPAYFSNNSFSSGVRQEIINAKLNGGNQNLDLKDQSPGIYFDKTISEFKQEVVKVIKD